MRCMDLLEVIETIPTEKNLSSLIKEYNIPPNSVWVQDSRIDLYYGRDRKLSPQAEELVADVRSGKFEHKFSTSIYYHTPAGDPYRFVGISLRFTKIQSSAGKSLEVRVPRYLYHITSGKHDDEIRKNGLKPQRANYSIPDERQLWPPGALHRSYTALHLTSTPKEVLSWLGWQQQSNTFAEVDTEKCKQHGIKFYEDINWDGPGKSVVTFDPIPPDCITQMWHNLGFKKPSRSKNTSLSS